MRLGANLFFYMPYMAYMVKKAVSSFSFQPNFLTTEHTEKSLQATENYFFFLP